MKNSETDSEFFDLIKNTLDNYEEHYILGSWENYVKQRKKRRKIILWRIGTGIAASLIIGWLGFRLIPSPALINSSDSAKQSPRFSNVVIPAAIDSLDNSILIRKLPSGKKETNLTGNDASARTSNNRSVYMLRNRVADTSKESQAMSDKLLASDAISNQEAYISDRADSQNLPDTLKAGISQSPNSTDTGKSGYETGRSDSSGYKAPYTQPDPLISIEKDIANRPSDQKFRFGVNISPGVTSTSTASSFNYSGGINADYTFLTAFRLSTGLQIEHLSVVNNVPSEDPALPGGETKAELVDLDIPLNITWKFLVRKSTSYYVSSGISSVVYLSEKYANTSYSQQMVEVVEVKDWKPNITYQMQNVKTTEQTSEEPLSTFDFASRVNIIFGFEQHLSSKLFLNVEPYLKIPISELATQNIKYTTGGITCKISF
jgi:hypothetical protein